MKRIFFIVLAIFVGSLLCIHDVGIVFAQTSTPATLTPPPATSATCGGLTGATYNACVSCSQNGSTGNTLVQCIRQTTPCYGYTGTALAQCQNAQASAGIRQQYNPNVQLGNGSSFGGATFSGVGGAIAGCANVGKFAINNVNKLFSKGKAAACKNESSTICKIVKNADSQRNAVSTSDEKAKTELQNMNNTQQCLNGVAYAVSKDLLKQVSNKTLQWISTGFGGNPLYVRDTGSYLKTIRDQQLSRFLQELPDENPIFGNVLRGALTSQVTGRTDAFINKQMDTPQAKQYQKFMDNFTQGGWDAWLNTTQNDGNNPIGAFFQATDRISNTINTQKENTTNEINRNQGFLDMKVCAQWANNGQVANALSGEPECARWETTTPGSVIADQVKLVTGSPIKQLEAADSINEVLGSFFDKLLNNLLTKGLGGLRGGGGVTALAGNAGSLGTNVVLGTDGQPVSGRNGGGLGFQLTASGMTAEDFDISRPQMLRSVIQAQYDFYNKAQDSTIAMNRSVAALGALDYCLPGPNPSWEQTIDQNYKSFLNSLQTPTKDSSLFKKVISSIPIIGSLFGTDNTIDNALAGVPVLYDPVTGQEVELSPYFFQSTRKKAVSGDLALFLGISYEELVTSIRKNFDQQTIINAFVAADPANATYARAAIKDAYKETTNLISYAQGAADLTNQYAQALSDTDDAIQELESIRSEVNTIVKTAKARYIAERAAQGNPVNLACINRAYVIDESPIVGTPRQESSVPSQMVQESGAASDYFYNNL